MKHGQKDGNGIVFVGSSGCPRRSRCVDVFQVTARTVRSMPTALIWTYDPIRGRLAQNALTLHDMDIPIGR